MREMAVRHWIDGGEAGDPVAESQRGRPAQQHALPQARRRLPAAPMEGMSGRAHPRFRERRVAVAEALQADALAVLLTRKNGKAIAQPRGEMAGAIFEILYYAALRVACALRTGAVWINEHNKPFAEAETGGYRQSGLGRLHGYDALANFAELKHIYQAPGVSAVAG